MTTPTPSTTAATSGRRTRPVAIFLPVLAGGGAERSSLILARGLSREGFDVDLVVGQATGPMADEVPAEARLVELGSPRVRLMVPSLVKYLRERRPVALMPTIGHASVMSIIAAKLARSQTEVVVRVVNTPTQISRGATSAAGRTSIALARRLYRHADVLTANSMDVADDLARFADVDRDAIKVIYSTLITDELSDLASQPLDHPWFTDDAPPVFLNVGRMMLQKDQALLLDAFALARQQRPNVRLLILGEGELRAKLEEQVRRLGIGDSVSMPGFDRNPYRYMSRASTFVLSSGWEGLPGALVEAMACGAPVVSTNCPSGPREILHGGRHGRLVPVDDPQALADAMLESLDDPIIAPPESWARHMEGAATEGYTQLLDGLLS